MKKIALLIFALLSSQLIEAQTLCINGEMDYLSCTLKNSTVISICGSPELLTPGAEGQVNGWLQFRERAPKKLQRVFPTKKDNSVALFEGNYFAPHGSERALSDLRFIRGKSLYSVSMTSGRPLSAGLSIQSSERTLSYACRTPIKGRYWNSFSELQYVLTTSNGQTNFLQEYQRLSPRGAAPQ